MSKASKSDLDASSTNGSESLGIDAGDQTPKYDKLVQDYVKLRSKLTVLKKAYVEQSDLSTKKDQTLRKYELEIEALSFRNQQLSVRVECLQRELEEKSQKAVTPSSSSSNSSINSIKPSAELLAEELQHKIEENQTLHLKLNELEVDLAQKIAKNQESLKQVEYDKMLLEKKLHALELSSKSSIEKLENDKIKLELSIIQLEDQLRSTHLENEQLIRKESEQNLVCQQNEKPLAHVNSVKLNNTLQGHLEFVFESLTQVYSSLEDLFGKKVKICKAVTKCALLLKQMVNSPNESNLSQFLNSNQDMLSILVENLLQSSQNIQMDKLNKKIKIYLNKLDQFLFQDETNFSLILKQIYQSVNLSKVLVANQSVYNQIEILIGIFDKILFAMNEKLSLKYSLDYSHDLTTLDECLVSHVAQFKHSLCTIHSSSNLIESLIELRSHFCTDNENQVDQVDPAEVQELKKLLEQKENFINELEAECKLLKDRHDCQDANIADLQAKLDALITETGRDEKKIDSLDQIEEKMERTSIQLYQSQIEALNKQIQLLDSKAVYYYDEMMSLIERIKVQMSINDVQSRDLNEIKDQLERTRSSYEMQISTMSDHLIEVNERMTIQGEENEKLRHELDMIYASKSAKAKRTK